jgi:hypothetical protein
MSGSYIPKNISIETLFPTEDGSKPYIGGKLDIKTLFGNNNKDNFDSRELLDIVKRRRKKLQECHEDAYKSCIRSIRLINNSALTDMVFTVSSYVPDCVDYNPYICLKYIKKKLGEQFIDTTILSTTEIFITWHNLERRLDNKK